MYVFFHTLWLFYVSSWIVVLKGTVNNSLCCDRRRSTHPWSNFLLLFSVKFFVLTNTWELFTSPQDLLFWGHGRQITLVFGLLVCLYASVFLSFSKITSIDFDMTQLSGLVKNYIRDNWLDFYARQHICYSAYMPRQFRLSVCLCVSVTRVYCV